MKYLSVKSGLVDKRSLRMNDMTGKRFGRLLVISRVATARRDQVRWMCTCDCGETIVVTGGTLRQGRNKSCGCLRRDRMGLLHKKHGKSRTTAYTMFYDARKRALELGLPFSLDPENIHIPTHCPVLGMELTLKGSRDSRPSLDRIIPSRGYTPENARVISFRANRIKSDATEEELLLVAGYIRSACAI